MLSRLAAPKNLHASAVAAASKNCSAGPAASIILQQGLKQIELIVLEYTLQEIIEEIKMFLKLLQLYYILFSYK